MVWPDGAPGEWEVLLDAHTGDVIHIRDQVFRRHHDHVPVPRHPNGTGNMTPELETSAPASRRVDGTGKAWIPDPITSAGVTYGGAYRDNNDADSDALNNERVEVTLRDIEYGSDGLYRLNGKYVVIDGNFGVNYSPPAESSADAFDYLRSNQHFEAVQVYYHVDYSQRYVQSLNVGRPIQEGGVRGQPARGRQQR